jgi:hypothetical protein
LGGGVQELPAIGQAFVEPRCGPACGELAEHGRQVRQRRHAVVCAGARKAVEQRGVLRGIM